MIGRDESTGASNPTVIFFFREDVCPALATWRKRSGTSYQVPLPSVPSLETDMIGWGLGGDDRTNSQMGPRDSGTSQLLPPAPGWRWEKWEAVASASPGPVDADEVLSSAFALAVFSQHGAGALRGVCRGQDGAKEQRTELLGWGCPRHCTGLSFIFLL